MVFSSLIFLIVFLPIVLVLHSFCPLKYRNILLLFASLFFYAWGEPVYILLMMFVIVFNWAIGKYTIGNKIILSIAVTVNLSVLVFFKYINFIITTYNSVFRKTVSMLDITLPIGISFFTFQAISYIVDLYREKYAPQNDLIKLALYISFFPQLIAGPIVRYIDIEKQLTDRVITYEKTALGIKRFIIGLSKKVLISNILGQSIDNVLSHPVKDISTLLCWITAIMYIMQIYFDFSGYSDMAIGLGKIFGFDFPENFNMPYISKSVCEFWRRWHISLGTWFREYLYIPLGGNRKGRTRTLINLFVVFAATGIWHGASWNFLIWGLWHGVFCVIERIGFKSVLEKHKFLSHIYTMFVVTVGFVIFRIDNTNYLIDYIKKMFLPCISSSGLYSFFEISNHQTIVVLIIAIILSGPILLLERLNIIKKSKDNCGFLNLFLCSSLLIICIVQLVSGTYNPFIYFRF